jgi:hypothetical protein
MAALSSTRGLDVRAGCFIGTNLCAGCAMVAASLNSSLDAEMRTRCWAISDAVRANLKGCSETVALKFYVFGGPRSFSMSRLK